MLRKIYPAGSGSAPHDVFKVVLLAEGFTSAQKQLFHNSCEELLARFLRTPPFNLTRIRPYWINVYSGFLASNQSGVASNAATPGRTVFESVFNTTTKTLAINQAKVNQFLEDPGTGFPFANDSVALTQYCVKGNYSTGRSATLVVLLLPPVPGEPATIEAESLPGVDDYHFIATTTNNHWHQVVIRSIAHKLGLGNEYELPGDEYQAPGHGPNAANGMNLQYLEAPPVSNRGAMLKWRHYFSSAQKILPPVVHAKSGDTSLPDRSLNAVPVSPSRIEFWEGGGGFRTGVYRSARDCLMRRRLGDPQLPVSAQPVPFCYVCRTFLKSLLE